MSDLTYIRDVLDVYYHLKGAYPKAQYPEWSGLYRAPAPNGDWIGGLVPDYTRELPRDPRYSDNPSEQYIYRSDGKDYKLISYDPEDIDVVRQRNPQMLDPLRTGDPSKTGGEASWAFGFWTKGAAMW